MFLLDVDNTLLDNDRVTADLRRYLTCEIGAERADAYWACFEKIRGELGYADYLGALQRYREAYPRDHHVLAVSRFMLAYPFKRSLFPQAIEVIHHLKRWGPVAILSDGDVVFQPRKIERSGLRKAVDHHVLVYIHKERELDDVADRYPADHYVMIDDKLHVLAGIKRRWGTRVTTLFVRQGHYANDAQILANNPAADKSIETISDVLKYDENELIGIERDG
jgi:FMN phosphatase YigB (HAD superfamily)